MNSRLDPAALDGEVHLWICRPDPSVDDALQTQYETLLNEEERVRWQRFRIARDRKRFLTTRALIRTVLSIYVERSPESWQFVHNRWGKPEIAPDQNDAALRANLTHTNGLICCAITGKTDIGVDVENVTRRSATMKVAERFFAPDEIAAMRALKGSERTERFFTYWTLKEAYIKARGISVAAGLRNFAFDVGYGGRIVVRFANGFADDPSLWNFSTLRFNARFRLALALKGLQERTTGSLRVMQITPQQNWQEIVPELLVPFAR